MANDESVDNYGALVRREAVHTDIAHVTDETGVSEPQRVIALIRAHSLWITQVYEQRLVSGEGQNFALYSMDTATARTLERLAQDKQVEPRVAARVLDACMFLRRLHFARRMNYYKRGGLHLEMIADWTPPAWVCSLFPIPALDREVVTLEYVVDALHGEIDLCTEWDSVPMGRVLHVAHILVSHQEEDGLWPAVLNLRTGYGVGDGRSSAPRNLMRRLNMILRSTEFDWAIQRIENALKQESTRRM